MIGGRFFGAFAEGLLFRQGDRFGPALNVELKGVLLSFQDFKEALV